MVKAQCTSHRKMQRNIMKYPTVSNDPATNSNWIYPAGSKGSAHVSPCEMPLPCPALTLSVHPELGLQHSCDTPGLSTSDLAIHSVARLVQVPHHWTWKWNDWQHDLASNSLNFGWAKSTKELSLLQSIQYTWHATNGIHLAHCVSWVVLPDPVSPTQTKIWQQEGCHAA